VNGIRIKRTLSIAKYSENSIIQKKISEIHSKWLYVKRQEINNNVPTLKEY
ncbi:hypothetical protein HispidOSU_013101, partial [Sigmodon hispidus]